MSLDGQSVNQMAAHIRTIIPRACARRRSNVQNPFRDDRAKFGSSTSEVWASMGVQNYPGPFPRGRSSTSNHLVLSRVISTTEMLSKSLHNLFEFITLRAKLSGAVYCYRSCLRVCVFATGERAGGVFLWVCYTITRNCVHRSSPNWVWWPPPAD